MTILDRAIFALMVALVALMLALAVVGVAKLLDRRENKQPTRRVPLGARSRRHFGLGIGSFEGRGK